MSSRELWRKVRDVEENGSRSWPSMNFISLQEGYGKDLYHARSAIKDIQWSAFVKRIGK